MSKKVEFIKYVENIFSVLKSNNIAIEDMNDEARAYWSGLQVGVGVGDKAAFTEGGKMIMAYLQANPTKDPLTARQIGENIGISSRSVVGSIRKLVSDGFVEKVGQEPSTYFITTKGKEIILED